MEILRSGSGGGKKTKVIEEGFGRGQKTTFPKCKKYFQRELALIIASLCSMYHISSAE
jgi:hypothetical protein